MRFVGNAVLFLLVVCASVVWTVVGLDAVGALTPVGGTLRCV